MDGSFLSFKRTCLGESACARNTVFAMLAASLIFTQSAGELFANQLELPPALVIGSTVASATANAASQTQPTAANMPPANIVHGLPIVLKRPLKRNLPVIDVIPKVDEGNIIRPRTAGSVTTIPAGTEPEHNTTSKSSTLPRTSSVQLPVKELPESTQQTTDKKPMSTESTAPAFGNPMLTIASKALSKIPGGVKEKVIYARSVANAGDLDGARAMCQALMRQSSGAPQDLALARSCVQFDVPLAKLRQLMKDSRMSEANRLVDQMLNWVGNVPEYRDYLLSIRAITAKKAATEDPASREQTILGVVQEILERYRENQGRFPLSYDELNSALPADAPPLTDYDIVSYYATEDAFSVKLQARANPLEVLSLHKTGLIK